MPAKTTGQKNVRPKKTLNFTVDNFNISQYADLNPSVQPSGVTISMYVTLNETPFSPRKLGSRKNALELSLTVFPIHALTLNPPL